MAHLSPQRVLSWWWGRSTANYCCVASYDRRSKICYLLHSVNTSMKFCLNSTSILLSRTSCPYRPPAAHPNQIKIICAGHAPNLPCLRQQVDSFSSCMFPLPFPVFPAPSAITFPYTRVIYLFFIFGIKLILFPSLADYGRAAEDVEKNKNKHITNSRYAQLKSFASKRCKNFVTSRGNFLYTLQIGYKSIITLCQPKCM